MTAARSSYVELHCHSAYSFLDGASHPEELAARAIEGDDRSVILHSEPLEFLLIARGDVATDHDQFDPFAERFVLYRGASCCGRDQ